MKKYFEPEEKITAYIARDENRAVYIIFRKPFKFNEFGSQEGKLIPFSKIKWKNIESSKEEITIKFCK